MKSVTIIIKLTVTLLWGVLLLGCQPHQSEVISSYIINDNQSQQVAPNEPVPVEKLNLAFCSQLSFKGIRWSNALSPVAQRSLSIALSISGRFEGQSGWQNITNNFDGMGLSAGLLNQTLGTESLQPLLASYEELFPQQFSALFSKDHYQSIKTMLDKWKAKTKWTVADSYASLGSEKMSRDVSLTSANRFNELMSVPASQSVQWAVSNLYTSNGNFIPSWKNELQTLLNKPIYVSYQVETAIRYHLRALSYVNRVKIFDLRTYLLMFDFVVQNGAISESQFQAWETKIKKNNITNTVDKLKALIDIRVSSTRPEYQADVRSRKYALATGYGTVHGQNFDFQKLHCFKNSDQPF